MNLRWEVGAPLMVLGVIAAGLTLRGGPLFWIAAVVAGVGLAIFLERL